MLYALRLRYFRIPLTGIVYIMGPAVLFTGMMYIMYLLLYLPGNY